MTALSKVRDRMGFLGFYTLAFIFFVYLPILFIPLFSFNEARSIAFPLQEFTFRWYREMWANESLMSAFKNSIQVGLSVAFVSTILGTLAAKAVTAYRLPGRGPVVGILMIPLVIPAIILGVAILIILNLVGVPLSLWTIGLGHLVVCAPFSMMMMVSRLEGFDRSMEEAAQDLGENGWWTFWRVTFPIALPGIVASLILTFTVSFDEIVIAFFLSGTDATLPVYIWSQLRVPNSLPRVLALGTIILSLSLLLVIFAEWFRRIGVKPEDSKG